MSARKSFRTVPGVMWEETPLGETILMNVHTLAYFALDALGTKLWQALQDSCSPDLAVRQVAADTGAAEADLRLKLSALMAGMERAGLVETEPY